MSDPLVVLRKIQEIDLAIHELNLTRTQLPRTLSERKTDLEQKTAALTTKQEDQKKVRMDADRREVDLKEREAQIQKLNLQLNTVKTNKEYSILQSEIAAIKADCGLIENDILEFMTRNEAAQKEAKALQGETEALQRELAEYQKQVDAALQELDDKIGSLKTGRKEAAEGVPKELLAKYDRILAHKTDGRALAQVVDGVCQGCHMEPTTQELNLLLGRKQVVMCKSCGRLLYV